ncbi:MAG: SulP family sulfate permease, partial [Oceanicoccus sp.]
VAGLFKLNLMRDLMKQNRREFYILLATFSITLLLGVQQGLLIGVTLSIFMVLYNTANPHMTELGAIQGGRLFRNVNRFSEAVVRDDVLIFRFDAPLYFANKDFFVEKLYTWVKSRKSDSLKFIVFDAEAVNSVDATAILMLQQVIENFRAQNIEFCISNAIGPVRDALSASSMHGHMNQHCMFSTIHDAIIFIDKGVNIHAEDALQTNM